MAGFGFECNSAQPCFFRHLERRVKLECHRDDIHATCPEENVDWSKVLELKWSKVLREGDVYSHLKCYRKRTRDGTWIIAHRKHIDAVLELIQNCKSAPTPITFTWLPEDLLKPALKPETATTYNHVWDCEVST